MDLLFESFKVDSQVDLTEREVIELCHGTGVAYNHQEDDNFNTSIETTTTVDDVSGEVYTYIVMPSLPSFLKNVDKDKLEHNLVKALHKEPESLPVGTPAQAPPSNSINQDEITIKFEAGKPIGEKSKHTHIPTKYDIGLIGRALDVEDAVRLFQRSLIILLKNDQFYFDIQAQQSANFKKDYELLRQKKVITSLSNTNEYINKYAKNVCFYAYNGIVTLNYQKSVGRASLEDEYTAWCNLKDIIASINPRYMQLVSPVTKQPRTVSEKSMIAAIGHLNNHFDMKSEYENFIYQSDINMAMLDFIKKMQPMYYDLKDLF